ncbi:hypothetical protein L6452_01312 [Arctium lappa]|uniref:Uncharacterized protein n=1 Tax=Arctium lappa TaxID=4217 RepID=A0ACB9FGZ2_ARCLA|nr:hypothetical protein L6452_01312 [Arctium lappa]
MVLISSLQEPKTSQSSGAEDVSVFKSRIPLNLRDPKTSQSSEAEDFSIFKTRRFLNLQSPKISQTLYTFLTKYICQHFKTKSPQDKSYILYHAEDLWPSLAQQVSHAFNA